MEHGRGFCPSPMGPPPLFSLHAPKPARVMASQDPGPFRLLFNIPEATAVDEVTSAPPHPLNVGRARSYRLDGTMILSARQLLVLTPVTVVWSLTVDCLITKLFL